MTFTPHGKNLIAGSWVAGGAQFMSSPANGAETTFFEGSADLVDQACEAAEAAFWPYSATNRTTRAAFLNLIADEIETRAAEITAIGCAETGLPQARLEGERGRTTGQLRMFASHILKDDFLDLRHDPALPDRTPMPRPDLRMIQRPVGPVAVFGASNFPLAFSTAGGDTAAALAAGCPVVVKGHPAHPGTTEIIAEAIHTAIETIGLHPGTFSMIHGSGVEVGTALVQHPFIQAVGFTGSLRAGRALFDLCAARPVPIPFFGELGSINPVFVLPEALAVRGAELGAAWAASLTMGAGQFCTNPGLLVLSDGAEATAFVDAAVAALEATEAQAMLTDGIASAYLAGLDQFAATDGVKTLERKDAKGRAAGSCLLETTVETWLAEKSLSEEVFGPLGLILRAHDVEDMLKLAHALEGQLTATLQMEDGDAELAARLLPVLERKAGRILANGFPTGVEVADAMVHGGPYPASTNFGATSVGTLAIRRFLRPVCYQNMPETMLGTD